MKEDGSVNGEIVHEGYERPYEQILAMRLGDAEEAQKLVL